MQRWCDCVASNLHGLPGAASLKDLETLCISQNVKVTHCAVHNVHGYDTPLRQSSMPSLRLHGVLTSA